MDWSRIDIFIYSIGNFGTFNTRFITRDNVGQAGFNQAGGVSTRGYGMLVTGEVRLVRGACRNIGGSHFVDMLVMLV